MAIYKTSVGNVHFQYIRNDPGSDKIKKFLSI
jgi:hypothetical protein